MRRGRGLQRRRRLLGASLGGAGDPLSHLVGVWERLTEGSGQRRAGSISCTDGKNGNGFKMCARALSDASTAVKRDVVQIVWQHGGDTATSVPLAVMSVLTFSCQWSGTALGVDA